jgi:hypothetical protein
MKTNTFFSIAKSLAIAILVLGIIHDIATFTPLIKEGLSSLNTENLNAVTYFSLICGTSLILCGIVLLLLLNKVSEYPFLRPIVLIIVGFLALNGILSVIFMFQNPFAWITMLLNLGMFGITVKLKSTKYKQVNG